MGHATQVMRHHCCHEMRRHLQLGVTGEPAERGRPIHYDTVFDEYAVLGAEHPSARAVIAYCPWCGSCLPASKRARWFDEVHDLGLAPDDAALQPRYTTDTWWSGEGPTP